MRIISIVMLGWLLLGCTLPKEGAILTKEAEAATRIPLEPGGNCSVVVPPCRYTVDNDNYGATEIAKDIYGERHVGSAGLIANLFRTNKGYVEVFDRTDTPIIPDLEEPVTLDYMLYYINEYLGFDYGVCEWKQEELYTFPCFYISNAETYETLLVEFYAREPYTHKQKLDGLQKANDIEYSTLGEQLIPVTNFEAGNIVIIPRLPAPQ